VREHADTSTAVVPTNSSNTNSKEQGKTDTAGISSPAKSVALAVVKHATYTEVRLRCSSKSRKAPPIPPPPTSVTNETMPLSTTGYDNVSEVSSVKDDNDRNRNSEVCENVRRDVSPCSNSTSSTTDNFHSRLPSTSGTNLDFSKIESENNKLCENVHRNVSPCNKLTASKSALSSGSSPDSKPALKPKPVTHTVVRESRTTIADSSISHSVKAPSSLPSSQTASSSESVPPVYAVVNKSRTLRSMSNIDSEVSNVTKSPGTNVTVARSNSAVAAGVAPPKKPPRTFVHSEYMKLKSCSLPWSLEPSVCSEKSSSLPRLSEPVISSEQTSSLPQSSEPSTGNERNSSLPRSSEASVECEEVGSHDVKTVSDENTDSITDLDNVDGDCTVQTQMPHKSGPFVTECSSSVHFDGKASRRQQSDKLPAPPRPPPPSFPPDSSRSSRSSVTDVELSNTDQTCSSTENCETHGQEHCSSMVPDDKQKLCIKPSSASDDDDDDDIYAVPGDVNNIATKQSNLTCNASATLTCNTSASSDTALRSVRDHLVSHWFVLVSESILLIHPVLC